MNPSQTQPAIRGEEILNSGREIQLLSLGGIDIRSTPQGFFHHKDKLKKSAL